MGGESGGEQGEGGGKGGGGGRCTTLWLELWTLERTASIICPFLSLTFAPGIRSSVLDETLAFMESVRAWVGGKGGPLGRGGEVGLLA